MEETELEHKKCEECGKKITGSGDTPGYIMTTFRNLNYGTFEFCSEKCGHKYAQKHQDFEMREIDVVRLHLFKEDIEKVLKEKKACRITRVEDISDRYLILDMHLFEI